MSLRHALISEEVGWEDGEKGAFPPPPRPKQDSPLSSSFCKSQLTSTDKGMAVWEFAWREKRLTSNLCVFPRVANSISGPDIFSQPPWLIQGSKSTHHITTLITKILMWFYIPYDTHTPHQHTAIYSGMPVLYQPTHRTAISMKCFSFDGFAAVPLAMLSVPAAEKTTTPPTKTTGCVTSRIPTIT
jgi:hypothetical protein